MGWFGSIGLAYKYFIIFGCLLTLTILAGLVKVFFDRRKLQKHAKLQSDGGPREDQVELNGREKDEGDLFGVRALEAGYFAGIAQSRPSSAAGSYVGTPSLSTNTLIGSSASPKIPAHSPGSSVTSLPLAHTQGRNSADPTPLLGGSNSPPRRKDPPTIKLRPSEAEMNGRINHSASVNMSLAVPPSPVLAKGPKPQTFNGDDDESDGHLTPRSLSPHSPTFPQHLKPDHYAPQPPQIPMPEGLSLSVRSVTTPENVGSQIKSQAASFEDRSPNHSTPPSPGPPPAIQPPSIPTAIQIDEPTESPYQAYNPAHRRDMSDASSLYSQENRKSMIQRNRSDSSESGITYNYSYPERSGRNSVSLSAESREQSRRPSGASSLTPSSALSTNESTHDPRFSEFYDSYYRQSQYGTATKTDAPKRPKDLNMTQPTIVEVPSPLPSPAVTGGPQLGMAL